jgi:hypothetical protein
MFIANTLVVLPGNELDGFVAAMRASHWINRHELRPA